MKDVGLYEGRQIAKGKIQVSEQILTKPHGGSPTGEERAVRLHGRGRGFQFESQISVDLEGRYHGHCGEKNGENHHTTLQK